MKIEKNKVAELSYCLEVEGQIADKADSSNPLSYIHGTGMLLPRFEEEARNRAKASSSCSPRKRATEYMKRPTR